MSKFVFTALALSFALTSQMSFASSEQAKTYGKGEAEVYVAGSQARATIYGDAAKVLYSSLDVLPEGHFGLVQTQTKKKGNLECQQAIMGDVPGQMSEPRYFCEFRVNTKAK